MKDNPFMKLSIVGSKLKGGKLRGMLNEMKREHTSLKLFVSKHFSSWRNIKMYAQDKGSDHIYISSLSFNQPDSQKYERLNGRGGESSSSNRRGGGSGSGNGIGGVKDLFLKALKKNKEI